MSGSRDHEDIYSDSRRQPGSARPRETTRGGRHQDSPRSSRNGSGSRPSSTNGRTSTRNRPPAPPLQDRYTYEEPRAARFDDVYSDSAYAVSHRDADKRRQRDTHHRNRVPPKRKRSHKGLVFFLVVVCLLGVGLYYVFGYMLGGLKLRNLTGDKNLLGINSAVLSDDGIKNIALFGLDAREDENEGRSDALMILTVDNKHDKLKVTSVLRDSNVSIRMTDEDGSVYYIDDKITHAYAYGGPECAINALNRNFHLDIEDYVTVNFIQMAKIVDAFGGVSIHISYDEMNEINRNLAMQQAESYDAEISDGDYLYEDGDMLLNGNQAVAYARIRYLDGDEIRAQRQQTVLKALIDRLRSKSKLEYPELIHTLMPMCETSLSFSDIMGMSPIILTDFTVETLSLPSEEENPTGGYNSQDAWVYVYDLEAAANHLNRFIYEEDAVPVSLGSDVTDVVSWEDAEDSGEEEYGY